MKHSFIIFTYWLSLTASCQVFANRDHPEKWYQIQWCQKNHGQLEVTLPNQTRCDCLTEYYAVEVEFADKWSDAVGQSLNYALESHKRAGIVLILESSLDDKYLKRLNAIIIHFGLPIKVWTVGAGNANG
jgi:hypothetical protein